MYLLIYIKNYKFFNYDLYQTKRVMETVTINPQRL